jgi:short-subunit dehydrogenase
MPKALITGASSGIGLELARIFAQNHYDLALVARSEEKLHQLASELSTAHVHVDVIAQDLARPDTPANVARLAGPIDVLVNNAGFGIYRPFADSELEDDLKLMHLNMDAVVALTKLCLPSMLERRRGRIMNVASTAAFQPGPTMALYYASKAFVLHFSEAIAYELRNSGVTVTALCPGPTETDFQRRAAMEDTRLVNMGMMTARQVADAGYRGLMAGKTVVIPGIKNKIGAQSVRFAPRKMVTAVVHKIQERVH